MQAAVGAIVLVSLVALVAFVVDRVQNQLRRDREARAATAFQALVDRFGEENARQIQTGSLWQGQTLEMLLAALGPPAAQDEKVLKTKTKRTFKYRPIAGGRGRYALRVFLEDDVVTGWEF